MNTRWWLAPAPLHARSPPGCAGTPRCAHLRATQLSRTGLRARARAQGYASFGRAVYAVAAAAAAAAAGCGVVAFLFARNGGFPHKTRCARVRGACAVLTRPTAALPCLCRSASSRLASAHNPPPPPPPPPRSFVRLLRTAVGVLFGAAYVGVLSLVAAPLNCQWLAPPGARLTHYAFPGTGARARCVH